MASPNTALLLSAILMLGTFHSPTSSGSSGTAKFQEETLRRAFGDFGVPIAIVIMVLMDFAFTDTYSSRSSTS